MYIYIYWNVQAEAGNELAQECIQAENVKDIFRCASIS